MSKLTEFNWSDFLGKLRPAIVAELGKAWDIPEWKAISSQQKKSNRQDAKAWASALINGKAIESQYGMVDLAGKIKKVGKPAGRGLIKKRLANKWPENYSDLTDIEIACLAYLHHKPVFNQIESWMTYESVDKWELFQAASPMPFVDDGSIYAILEEHLTDLWKDEKFTGRCVASIYTKEDEDVAIIDIDYEQEPKSMRVFANKPGSRETTLNVACPIREAFFAYNSKTGLLKARLYRANEDKYRDVVRLVAEICFDNADLFPTGNKRTTRYDLKKFSQRPEFLKPENQVEKKMVDPNLERIIATALTFTSPYNSHGTIEVKIPSKTAWSTGRDVYDVLSPDLSSQSLEILCIELRAHFREGSRKVLPISIYSTGCSVSSGDPKYSIIDKQLKKWGVFT
jgi:hypothetical protein